jgi:PAS domain S-box-containing protein
MPKNNQTLHKIGLAVFLLIVAASVFVFIAAFQQTQTLVMDSTTYEARTSATNAAGLIDGNALALLGPGDEGTAAYREVQKNLNNIRKANPDIQYIYTMKRINGTVVFIVDGDYNNPAALLPGARIGDRYFNATPALLNGFNGPVTEPTFMTDEWGTVFSAYAPVYTRQGESAGIVGIDIDANLISSRLTALKILNIIVLLMTFILAVSVAVFASFTNQQALTVLKESEEKFRNIFDNANDAIHLHAIEPDGRPGKFIDVNDAACRMLKMTREEMLNHTPLDFATEYHNPPMATVFSLLKNQGSAIFETGLRGSDGKITPVEVNAHIITLHGEKFTLSVIRDITERQQAEETIRKSEEQFRSIFQTQMAGLFMVDTDTYQIHDINDAALALIGLPREQVVGKVCHAFICPAEVGKCPVLDLGQTVDNAERVLIRSDGTRIPILKSVKPVKIGGKRFLIESFVDISERKKMEEKNARLIRELESANTELKDFAYVVSHDLKAPLRAIGSLSQWLYTDYRDKFDEEGKASLDLIVNRVNRMQGLIEGILEYSRVGRVHEQTESVDLGVLVHDVIDSLSVPSHISVTVDTELPVVVYEKTRIHQVFANLIGNAVKYMNKPTGEVHVSCTRDDAFWTFAIRDTGPGIDARYFEKIFQIFQTLHPRDQVESTGIGLSIVKRIIETNGGRVWVESELGRGSIFYFTVPITRTKEQDTS